MRPVIRTANAVDALKDTATAFDGGTSPLAAWGSDELRLGDGSVLVAGVRRASDGGELVGCWRIHHLGGTLIASYDLDVRGLRPVE